MLVGTGENQVKDMFPLAHTDRGVNTTAMSQMSEVSLRNEALSDVRVCLDDGL